MVPDPLIPWVLSNLYLSYTPDIVYLQNYIIIDWVVNACKLSKQLKHLPTFYIIKYILYVH